MSHIIIVKINNNIIEIIINKNIKELLHDDIIKLYKLIIVIRTYELKNGNEIEKSQLYISYKNEMYIKEYINIFKIIRYGTLLEIYEYFKNFNDLKNIQNTISNININDYITYYDNMKQSIIIIFIYKVNINKNIIKNEIINLSKLLDIGSIENLK